MMSSQGHLLLGTIIGLISGAAMTLLALWVWNAVDEHKQDAFFDCDGEQQ